MPCVVVSAHFANVGEFFEEPPKREVKRKAMISRYE